MTSGLAVAQATTDYSGSGSGGLGATFFVLIFVFVALYIAAFWAIFKKAGQPGWASLIPFYNAYVMFKIVGRPWWWILLFLIPLVNIVIGIILALDLAKSFGKEAGFAVGLIFLGFIFYPILGFGSAQYVGPAGARS